MTVVQRTGMVLVILSVVSNLNFSIVQAEQHLAAADEKSMTDMLMEDHGIPTSPAEVQAEQRRFLGKFWGRAAEDLPQIPGIVIENAKEIVLDWDQAFWLLAAGGASIALHSEGADDRMEKDIRDNAFIAHDMDKVIDLVGGPGFHFGVAGLWYLIAAEQGNEKGLEQSWTMIKALSVSGAGTLALKLARNNHTPNDKPLAWPSGHTSSSFTVAAVLDEFYGPGIGIPAYLGAGFVGYRMMESGDHWPSDVLFGAVWGYLVGHHVAGKDKETRIGGFQIMPYTDVDSVSDRAVTGLSLLKRF
ncbi:MAG: phosphatase PAP2 family protein [Phycisphaerae bacterium]|nr:phosphatase PAP2 family protein [Phycisphaerae bacterium]